MTRGGDTIKMECVGFSKTGISVLTLQGLRSGFRQFSLKLEVVCPKTGTAARKRLNPDAEVRSGASGSISDSLTVSRVLSATGAIGDHRVGTEVAPGSTLQEKFTSCHNIPVSPLLVEEALSLFLGRKLLALYSSEAISGQKYLSESQ